ncbi:fructose-bisphosphate aldolase, chloroplastic-like isoform X2 [Solanum tuberosum]|uniref:fructose-bisphosphate aldolase, chloroplastic-like isoform X2 n=1 Tax=Solanum tuberosum TaxID=4113 RepID=UPI00073A30CB|nr:PREDICTED: fructose-bisphosphate aldolase, chloroplastic-like isoform X2 [Solanum tuberosum]
MFLLNKTLLLVSKLTRVWFPLLVQMMSHGAKVSMALPRALLLTTNKELTLPNVSIPNRPSALAVKEAAWGLARYAAISQDSSLVPIVEPQILLDGDHGIDRTFEVAQKVWAEVFVYLVAEDNVMFEGILLKRSMVTPGAECKDRATPEQVADYTLKLLQRRIPPAVPGIMFLSGGQSEVEATFNLNAMNHSPTPWHMSFSYARALQNTCLKTWRGLPENVKAAQDKLLIRAKANSLAQLGKYTGESYVY